jgi:hypothetical protein
LLHYANRTYPQPPIRSFDGLLVAKQTTDNTKYSTGERAMVNHLTRGKELRIRATRYETSAKNTTLEKFGECYRLLAKNFNVLATLEEEFFQREIVARTENNVTLIPH